MEANCESTFAQCLLFCIGVKNQVKFFFASDVGFEKFFGSVVARIRVVAKQRPTLLLLFAYHSCLVVVVFVGVLGNQVEGVRTLSWLQIALGA